MCHECVVPEEKNFIKIVSLQHEFFVGYKRSKFCSPSYADKLVEHTKSGCWFIRRFPHSSFHSLDAILFHAINQPPPQSKKI